MVKVVQLTEWQAKETTEALARLAELARQGQVLGMAICYVMRSGEEVVLRTGPFRKRGVASRAGFLMQMEDFALPDTMFG